MTPKRAAEITLWLGLVLAALYLVAGVLGAVFGDYEPASDGVIRAVLLCGGAAFIVVGLFATRVSAWLSALLVTIGALAGALVLFWTVVVPLAAAALAAMSFALARRPANPA